MRDMSFAAQAARWLGAGVLAAVLAACGDSGKKTESAARGDADGIPVMEERASVPASELLPPIQENPEPSEMPVGRLPDWVKPTNYDLHLHIVPDNPTFSGEVRIGVTFEREANFIWLHGQDLKVTSAAVVLPDGREIAAAWEQVHPTGVARVDFTAPVPAGEAVLHFRYEAPFNERLAGLYRVEEGGRYYVVTQFEATDARRAFPSFDEPSFKVPFDIAVTARKDDIVVTNTPQAEEEPAGEGLVRHSFATTKPLPTYLLAFAVGPYDLVPADDIPPSDGLRARPVPLRAVAARGKGGNLAYALQHTPGILGALENYFGVEYPYPKLDLIAAPQFAFGAMENAGAIIYAERLLLLNEDASLNQRRAYALVHAHELAHHWFGDLVTPEWWSDIWLNEAFATWMGNKAAHAWNPKGEFDRETLRDALDQAMPVDSLSSARQIRQPVTRNEDIINSFDSITYQKGGAVLSMFESYLGEERFREGVRLHMKRYAHGVANTDQFMESLADGAGDADVVPAFASFIDQPGVPMVSAQSDCTEEGPARVKLTQAPFRRLGAAIPADRRWKIPACVRAIGAKGTEKTCILIDGEAATVELKGACPMAVMPNADGAGYYRWTLSGVGWLALTQELGRLNVREALSFADSLWAALDADAIDAARFFDGVRVVAAHEAWDVATFSIERFVKLGNILDTDHRRKLHAFGAELYRPRLGEIGLMPAEREPDAARLLRVPLAGYLALHARDEAVREKLKLMGQKYVGLGGDGKLHPEETPSDLRALALAVAAQEIGEAFTKRLTELLAGSGDAELRQGIVRALGAVEDPALAADIRAFTLGDTMRLREIGIVIGAQLENPVVQDEAWNWYRTNFEALMAKLPPVRRNGAPAAARHFCSEERLTEARTFFTEHAVPGAERSFNLTMEAIELCMAFRTAKAAEIAAWLDENVGEETAASDE